MELRLRPAALASLAVLLGWLCTHPLLGQAPDPAPPAGDAVPAMPEAVIPAPARPSAIGMTDAYGNAQFDLPDRRPLGIFGYQPEWQDLGGYEVLGRRADQRGGPNAFALPGELLGLSTMQTLAETVSPSVIADVTPAKRLAMLEYGGFGERYAGPEADGIAAAFARKHRLVSATSLYSPVYRAMMKNASLAGARAMTLRSSLSDEPAAAPRLPESTEYAGSLYDVLKTDAAVSHTRSKANAWELFAEGEYRQAARAFESALTLGSDDDEARVGELFSYVAVGSMSTAAVLVRQLNRHDRNPFLLDLDMKSRLAATGLADKILMDARVRVQTTAGPTNPNVLAAYVFILWHLEDRDAALNAALALADGPGAGEFADWPAKMRAAQSAPRH